LCSRCCSYSILYSSSFAVFGFYLLPVGLAVTGAYILLNVEEEKEYAENTLGWVLFYAGLGLIYILSFVCFLAEDFLSALFLNIYHRFL